MTAPSLRETFALIHADLRHRSDYERKPLTTLQVLKFLLNGAALSTVIFRLQIWCHTHHLQAIGYLLRSFNAVVLTVHIDPDARIGPGLFIMHANYIWIGPRVNIGRNCLLAHQNSIGPSPFYAGDRPASRQGPTIGDGARLGGGACVIGAITLGRDVHISMNTAVDSDFPDQAVLFGVPAKNLSRVRQCEEQV